MRWLRILLVLLPFFLLTSMIPINSESNPPEFRSSEREDHFCQQMDWVEGQLQSMTPDQRIGQLFMVAAYSNKGEDHKKNISYMVRKYNIGGLIFFQGTPNKQAELTNYYQSQATTPLLVAIDGEWGLSMRLKGTTRFPKQLTLGAIKDNRLIYDMGMEIARQCRRMGIHVNLAPVVDVNNNANNPVINDRSFGEDKYNVAEKGISYMQGMEMNGILACAKHFPGHGDTNSDSHYTLPVIRHSQQRLNDIELYPFRQLANENIGGMMIAHLAIPALDNTPVKPGSSMAMPTTLSKKVVTNLLKNDMGYQGLVFTDALNMKGVSSFFQPGVVDVKALLAGNDILLFPQHVGNAIKEIKAAIARGEITQYEIDNRVRKILRAKHRVGLSSYRPIQMSNLMNDLNSPQAELLKRRLIESSMTLARNDLELVPFRLLEQKSFASISVGASTLTEFQRTLGKYANFQHHSIKFSDSETRYNQKFDALKRYNTVVIGIHDMSKSASKNYSLNNKVLNLIRSLEKHTNVVLVVFGSPYSLKNFDRSQTVLVGYEDNYISQGVAAQVLFGAIPARGVLPVSSSPRFQYGQGIFTSGSNRLKYTIPEEIGIDSRDLLAIDRIANEAIRNRATPGCQVLVAKDGNVIFEKSYGYHTYSKNVPVQSSDLYDLASITKITSSALGLMDMYEKNQLNLYGRLHEYLPEVLGTNKQSLMIKDMLIHESGLKSWIPFYKETIADRYRIYTSSPSSTHSTPVAQDMYIRNDYANTMLNKINDSELPNVGEYKYSDLGYYYFKKIIENYASEPLDQYVSRKFYAPMGLHTMGYNPHERFSPRRIPPTENDASWRRQIVKGYVHDMGAAMLGGVGGHAGVFSNAHDLAAIMQMLLNEGSYGGQMYFQPSTIQKFTAKQKQGNRRGLAFDKPDTNNPDRSPASKYASYKTFGHTGFTGTCAWADPQHNLVFIFLSNRTYPDSGNRKLIRDNVRTRMHDVVYQAVQRSSRTAQY